MNANIREIIQLISVSFGDKSFMAKNEKIEKLKEEAISIIDENGNGRIDIEDFIIKAMKTPGIRIKRSEFLEKELTVHCGKEMTQRAIKENPYKAGVSKELLDEIATNVIKLERNKTSLASMGLGSVPGGITVQIGTTVVDLTQYHVFMIRVAQKLLYLYGFPQIGEEGNDGSFIIDSGTMNLLLLCVGAMQGLQEAIKGIRWVAQGLAKGVEKALLKKALTQGMLYPLVKNIMKMLSVRITKQIFSKFVANSIVFVGGALCGGITFVSFDTCCRTFSKVIKETALSNPDMIEEELEVIDIQPGEVI